MVTSKEVLQQSSHRIEANIYVVVEFLEIQNSVSFEFCIDYDLIEFWWADLMFEVPHDTHFLEYPPYNGGDLLLSGPTVVGYGGFDVSF